MTNDRPKHRAGNHIRARSILIAIASSSLLLLATAASSYAACANAQLDPNATNTALISKATVCLVNAERTKLGIKPLKSNRKLTRIAQSHSAKMAKENFFDHTDPDGTTFFKRVKRSGYLTGVRSYLVGENILISTGNFATPTQIVANWMNSKPHRKNLLNATFSELGSGVAISQASGAFFTHDFGTRKK